MIARLFCGECNKTIEADCGHDTPQMGLCIECERDNLRDRVMELEEALQRIFVDELAYYGLTYTICRWCAKSARSDQPIRHMETCPFAALEKEGDEQDG